MIWIQGLALPPLSYVPLNELLTTSCLGLLICEMKLRALMQNQDGDPGVSLTGSLGG